MLFVHNCLQIDLENDGLDSLFIYFVSFSLFHESILTRILDLLF